MSARLNVFLLITLVFLSLSLVNAQYQARHLFIELERAQSLSRQYDVEWSQLKLDQSTFGKNSRIEQLATDELNMVPVTPQRTQYLTAELPK